MPISGYEYLDNQSDSITCVNTFVLCFENDTRFYKIKTTFWNMKNAKLCPETWNTGNEQLVFRRMIGPCKGKQSAHLNLPR